ncbi:hypothetical protein Hypma_015024 [Hypsizygus marmoreus]|uniref:BTB domain-containing protein n=1 Tax=Hypsizygus marmoreus TaxID=39966 RepID=A0A369K8Z9_HYPMA|nr:hypothetical protein Hypma_015024 [Hypsizygus marmoreus]
MVHLYVFNPARKLRLLSMLFYRGSKRILGSVDTAAVVSTQSRKPALSAIFRTALPTPHPLERETARDADYYAEANQGFCVFQVENTLFKVHRVLLSREPSAFSDMFSLPQPNDDASGSDHVPIFLSDSVQQFRDFLWALYAPPCDLFLEGQLDRLLNIAELANKYCFTSFESWITERIYTLAQDLSGPLCSASPELCRRILDVSILCNHKKLQDLVTQHLISRILWYNTQPDAIVDAARQHGLRTLLGVSFYRQLVNMQHLSRKSSDGKNSGTTAKTKINTTRTEFPPSMDAEARVRFLAAHHSLLSLWEHVRSTPPSIASVPDTQCTSHAQCELAWQHLWFAAGSLDEALRGGSADILGRLKAMMLGLRKAMSDAPFMTMGCKMAALEAITEVRDEIIAGLAGHFEEASWVSFCAFLFCGDDVF